MARTNYFQDMKNKYQGNEDWINLVSTQDIQKSAVKRIFKEMVNGAYDYGKEGNYFLDSRFLENLIIAAGAKLEYYTLLSNAVMMYKECCPAYPNLGAHFTHIQNLQYIYGTIYNKLMNVKFAYNVSPLIDISPATYNYRNDINNE